jgi:hypothetical protein
MKLKAFVFLAAAVGALFLGSNAGMATPAAPSS